jgi:hypothetical protein
MISCRGLLPLILACGLAGGALAEGEQRPDMLRPGLVEYPDGREGLLLPDALPFGAGEVLDFDILYGALRVGKARLETRSLERKDGRPALTILSRAKSEGWVDAVYKVRDQIESILDLERLHSLGLSKHLREGKYRYDSEAIYLHEEGIVRYADGSEKELVPGSQDVLTALFYIRTFPLEVGMTLHIPVHDGKKGYPLRVIVRRRETVKTEFGNIECLVLEPKMKSRGLFKSEGQLLVYLSDDERRLPVLLKAKAPVGSFTSQLKSHKRGRALEGLAWQGD